MKVAGAGSVAKKQTRFPFVSAADNGCRTSQELSALFPQGLNKDPPRTFVEHLLFVWRRADARSLSPAPMWANRAW
ncbi:MAG: hypothetical protein ACKPKO_14415, partial [Candidatus Fonsibacter sp.]